MLTRLIYSSRSLCSAEDAQRICADARTANALQGVTGALYLANDTFWQYLEGDEIAVPALYSRIQRDPRHADCQLLDSRLISARVFKGWSMAWLPRTVDTDLVMQALIPGSSAGVASMDGGSAGAFFLALARGAERQ